MVNYQVTPEQSEIEAQERAAIPLYCSCQKNLGNPDGEPTPFYLFGISSKKTLLICCTQCGGTKEIG